MHQLSLKIGRLASRSADPILDLARLIKPGSTGGRLFNPELVERHDSGKYVYAADYDSLLHHYREAIECLLGMVSSSAHAMDFLGKAWPDPA